MTVTPRDNWVRVGLGIFMGIIIGRLSFVDHYFDTHTQVEVFAFAIVAVAILVIATIKNNQNLFK